MSCYFFMLFQRIDDVVHWSLRELTIRLFGCVCASILHFLLPVCGARHIDVQQEAITWSIFGTQQFFDEVQVLMAFEIVWMVGFVWSFFIKAPGNIHSLFLRSKLFV